MYLRAAAWVEADSIRRREVESMYKSPDHRAAEAVVRSMGVTCVNVSIRQFIYALELLHQNPRMIHSITTQLHPAVKEFYPDSSLDAVERNLRWARDTILKRADPERLRQVMGFTLRITPSVGDLLDSIGYYMEREGLWPD